MKQYIILICFITLQLFAQDTNSAINFTESSLYRSTQMTPSEIKQEATQAHLLRAGGSLLLTAGTVGAVMAIEFMSYGISHHDSRDFFIGSSLLTTATFSFIYGIKMIAKGNQLGYTISPEVSSKMYRATGVSLIALGTASLFPSSLITLIGMFHELGSPGVVAFGVGSIGISILGITQGIKMVRKGNKIRDTNITTAPLIDPFSHRYGMIVCFEF